MVSIFDPEVFIFVKNEKFLRPHETNLFDDKKYYKQFAEFHLNAKIDFSVS